MTSGIIRIALFVAMSLVFDRARADVQPLPERVATILETRCLHCHAGEKPKGGLSLVSQEALATGGEGGPAVISDHPFLV